MMERVTRDHVCALNSKVNQFRADNAYCDVEIHVEGSVFKCHRLILAAVSEYFQIMFGGKFVESTASEVTLRDVEADTFKDVLGFIYTGEVSVNHANLFKLIRASDFFKLARVEECCIIFVQQNMNIPIKDGLEIFSYVRVTGKTKTSEIIGQNIYKNFEYFSTTPKLLEIPFEEFMAILNLTSSSTSEVQDKFMCAILRWIRHTKRSPQDRKSHFCKLLSKIDFTRLSAGCMRDLANTSFEDFVLSGVRPCPYVVDSEVEEVIDLARLLVYVNYNIVLQQSRSIPYMTRVFNINAQCNEPKWVNSYRYDHNRSSNHMRTIVLDGRLYRLSYSSIESSVARPLKEQQNFETSSCISFSSSFSSCLKHPPLIMDRYEMCGLGKHIYVYNRNTSRIIPRDSTDKSFDRDELSRGIYLYNREVGTWLSVPPLNPLLINACMTCDDRMVYLIGSTNSQNYVQGYDDRTSAWLSLPPTHGAFTGAACCAHQNKIYVSGGHQNPKSMEMFDPVAGKWQNMEPMKHGRYNHRIESYLRSKSFLVTAGETLSTDSDVELYYVATNQWKPVTSLYKSVLDDGLKYSQENKIYWKGYDSRYFKRFDNYEVIDIMTYEPYGL